MGMLAVEFIESKREILNEREKFWSDPLLLFTLNEAYKSLQIDMPYFKEIKFLTTEKGVWQYRIENLLQPIKVLVNNREYTILSDTRFFDKKDSEDGICSAYDYHLCLSKTPLEDGHIIECRYKYVHQISTLDCELKLPDHYMEALHANFLCKVWEKNPDRKDRTLVNAYKQDYALALRALQEVARTKPRKQKSYFKKV